MTRQGIHTAAAARLGCLAFSVVLVSGCVTWRAPEQADGALLQSQVVTETRSGVELSAAVLGAEDSLRILGTDVTGQGIQPVWVEVRNRTDQVLWLLRSGVDPDYFSPLEVAWLAHVPMGGDTNDRIDDHFDRVAFPNPIPAGAVSRGLLFTNPQPVVKVLNVDLLGNRMMIPFTLFVPVPGEGARGTEFVHRYADAEIANFDDLGQLRRGLQEMPCCVDVDGVAGAPLNVVLIGALDDIAAALARRGYRRGRAGPGESGQVFGRPFDVVLRKRAQAGASATWLAVWRAPMNFRGQAVFFAQCARPVGGRFLDGDSSAVTPHPDVDEARDLVIQDLMYSGGLERLGFLKRAGAAPVAGTRTPEGGDHVSDGRRAVLFFGLRPLDFADVEILDWETTVAPQAGATKGASIHAAW